MILKTLGTALLAAGLLTSAALVQAETVRWSRSADVTTLDPHVFNTGTNFVLMHQMYETLVNRTADGKLKPLLATEWKMLESDPTVWEFKLRPNVKFHDGTPLTAKDVVFSLNRARGPNAQVKSLLASVDSIKAVDDLTVHVKTKGPNLIFPNNLTNLFIMSEDWAKKNNATETQDPNSKQENGATRAVNGTGAFMLASREIDSKTVMKQNPNYWGTDQVGDVTELVYLPIKSPATRVAALLSGEVDFAQDIPAQDVARLKQDSKLRINEGPENRSIFLGLNVGAAELKSSNVKGKNPLADPKVREAIELAIDRDAIKRSVMRGLSNPSGVMAPPFVNGYDKSMAAYNKADINKAKQLLKEAGYSDGFTITLHSPNDRYVNDEAISTAIAGFLGRIGIKTEVSSRPIAQHSVSIVNADSDFYLYGWGVPTYDSAYIFDFLVATRGKEGRGALNATGYSNPEVDAKIISLSSESDVAKRNDTIKQIWDVVQK
ncbi:MAG: ABC transporter substrate-binding protein, partial [Comamonadaceae bacterium]|nr:ABC transporter substrate-binding protein [Comamonadaceae bacterium]